MSTTPIFLAVVAALVFMAGLITWAWFALNKVDEALLSISSFEAMQFDM